jgi:hypothetical protein
MNKLLQLIALVCALGLLACDSEQDDCDRSGCKAVEQPASGYSIETGIAGAAASDSDLVMNGCAECTFASSGFHVYESTTPILTAEEAQALIDLQGVPQVVEFDGTYEDELAPGEYLVCEGHDDGVLTSVGITVNAGEVTTINVRYLNAPTEFIVFLPGATEPSTDRIFEISMP